MKKATVKAIITTLVLLLVACTVFTLASIVNPLYGQVDNYSIAIVLNRTFGEEAYVLFLHPWFCSFVAAVSKVFPSADAFTLTGHVLQLSALFSVLMLIMKNQSSCLKQKALYSLICICTYISLHIFSANYTILAASFAITGSVHLLSDLSAPSKAKKLLGAFFISAGIMFRANGAYLTFPFLFLEIFIRFLESKPRRAFVRKTAKTFALTLLCAVILIASKSVIDHSDAYASATRHNTLRSLTTDYPHKPYDQVSHLLPEISESEYTAATKWITIDTERQNDETYTAIADAHSGMNALEINNISFIELIGQFVSYIRQNLSWSLSLLTAAALFCLCLVLKSRVRALHALLLLSGSAAIILFFALKGRANDRVWVPVMLSLLSFSCTAAGQNMHLSARKMCILAGIAMLLSCSITLLRSDFHSPALALNARKNNEGIVTQENAESSDLFIWHNWHMDVSVHYMQAGKLPTKDFLEHNIPSGEWFYRQVYFDNHLNKIDAVNPAAALFERENTYLAVKSMPKIYETLFSDMYAAYSIESAFPIETEFDTVNAYRFVPSESSAPAESEIAQ